jgi:hypothetical protein
MVDGAEASSLTGFSGAGVPWMRSRSDATG